MLLRTGVTMERKMPSAGGSVDQLITQSSWRLLRQPLFLVPVKTRDRIGLSYKNLCLEVKDNDNMKQVFAEYKGRENRRKKNEQRKNKEKT